MAVNSAMKYAGGSIAVGVGVLGLKMLAAYVSASTALFSDALETLVNVASSSLALYALIIAAKPADSEHHYGHAKAELLSAVATGAMILAAAGLICDRAVNALLHPAGLMPLGGGLGLGLAVNGLAGVVNALWAYVLHVVGRRHKSPALLADSQHLLSDVLTTLGVLVALLAAGLLHWPVLDPLIALAVAAQIAVMGAKTVSRSISGLLDEAPPPEMTAHLQDIVRNHAAGAIEAHDLRVRQAGPASFLEFHLVVPGAMTVDAAHEICDRIEAALKAEMEGLVVTIHVEPEEKAKHEGRMLVRQSRVGRGAAPGRGKANGSADLARR